MPLRGISQFYPSSYPSLRHRLRLMDRIAVAFREMLTAQKELGSLQESDLRVRPDLNAGFTHEVTLVAEPVPQ